jgi:hypothetical protein
MIVNSNPYFIDTCRCEPQGSLTTPGLFRLFSKTIYVAKFIFKNVTSEVMHIGLSTQRIEKCKQKSDIPKIRLKTKMNEVVRR